MDVLRSGERQFGFLRLIYYTGEKGEKPLTEIIDDAQMSVHQLYSFSGKAK
ncbi:MAG: hypothetical protein QXU18_13500 [Thermoplasmatales archaeon]